MSSHSVATAGAFLDVRHCDPNRIISVADWHPKKTTFDKHSTRKRGYPLGERGDGSDWLIELPWTPIAELHDTLLDLNLGNTHVAQVKKKNKNKNREDSIVFSVPYRLSSVLDEILSNNHLTSPLKMIEAIRLYAHTSFEIMTTRWRKG